MWRWRDSGRVLSGPRVTVGARGHRRIVVGGLAAPFGAGLFLVLAPHFGFKPLIGTEFFPPSDEAQFRINVKAPIGTRIEETERIVRGMESIVRATVRPEELKTIVANVGIPQGRSAVFTSNTGPHSATVQVYLTTADKRARNDREIVNAIRPKFTGQFPGTRYQFVSGGLVSGVVNFGSESADAEGVPGNDLSTADGVFRPVDGSLEMSEG